MWELDHKESWPLKNWCFPTGVLVKILESSFDCKDIKLVNPKGNQPWISIGRTDAEAETPILWPPHVKNQLFWKYPDAGKVWRQEEKGTTEGEMVGWHHQLNDHEFEWALGVGDGQGSLVCCSPSGQKSWTWLTELIRRRQWHPTPVLLPGKSHGWRSLVGCSPWGCESQTWLSDFTFTFHFHALERKWQPTSAFLPGESQGWGSLGGCMHAKLLHCVWPCDPMDCSPPGPSVHGILQARILEWIAFPPPGDLPDLGIEPMSLKSHALAGGFFTTSATGKALKANSLFELEFSWFRKLIISVEAFSLLLSGFRDLNLHCQRRLLCFSSYDCPNKVPQTGWLQRTQVEGTSLVVWWLRIHLPMQGTQVWSLVEALISHMPHLTCN